MRKGRKFCWTKRIHFFSGEKTSMNQRIRKFKETEQCTVIHENNWGKAKTNREGFSENELIT